MNFILLLGALLVCLFAFAVIWLLISAFVSEVREKDGDLTRPTINPDEPRTLEPVNWVIGLMLLVTIFMILTRCDQG